MESASLDLAPANEGSMRSLLGRNIVVGSLQAIQGLAGVAVVEFEMSSSVLQYYV